MSFKGNLMLNKIKQEINEFKENYYLIKQITIRDVTVQYKKSKMGMIWTVLEPLGFVLILYVVFGLGLKSGRSMTIPYLCYLIVGLSVMNLYLEVVNRGTVAIKSHSYLLKKVKFKVSILPISVVLVGIINHFLFLIAVFIVLFIYGFYPTIYWIQILYFLFSLSSLLLGISLFNSTIAIFIPDIRNVINLVNRGLFYLTPIFWTEKEMPAQFIKYAKLNPLYYIVNGYREVLFNNDRIGKISMNQTIYFWFWVVASFVIGMIMFQKLKKYFNDFV